MAVSFYKLAAVFAIQLPKATKLIRYYFYFCIYNV